MSQIDELIQEFAEDVPNYISTAIVDMNSGMGVGSYSADPDFDAGAANAAYTDFVQANRDALEILGADPLDTTDILVTTNGMYLLIRELSEDYYMGTAISQDGNLALARKQMEQYEEKFLRELPGAGDAASSEEERASRNSVVG
jgi:predicted regulator of Ras-like GTPase activity (Roadblock/LC7/MglB family)